MLDINRTTLDIPSESMAFRSGKIIGKYTVDKLLFEGTQSQSFSIKNDNTKIIKVYFIGEEPNMELVRKLSQNNDPSLLRIYQYGTCAEHFYCIEKKYNNISPMQNEGLSVQKKMIEGEKKAVNAFHALGFVHLDIKKEHFKCDENGNVVIIDIGYAHRLGSSFNKSPSCFSAPEIYAGRFSKESDYYSFGIAVLEQFFPDLLKGKTKQEIKAFVNSDEPLNMANRLPACLMDDVKRMLADNPSVRALYKTPISEINNITERVYHRQNNHPTLNVSELKPLLVYEVLELAHKGDVQVFKNKVLKVLKETSWNNPSSVNATYMYLKFIPRGSTEKNYTNLSGKNINEFFAKLKVYTTPTRLHFHNPLKFMRHLRFFKKFYVMDKTLVQRLDKQGAEISAFNEKKAWAILKCIGITLGVLCVIAIAIGIIVAILYILAIIIGIIIAICVIAGLIAASGG